MSSIQKDLTLKGFIESHGFKTVFFDSIDSKHMVTYKSSQYAIRGKITETTLLDKLETISSVLFELDRTGVTIREAPSEENEEGAIIFRN